MRPWQDARWVRNQRRRLAYLGAPQAVRDRWEAWLAAVSELPPELLRPWVAEQLDDPEAPMPGGEVFS